MNSQIPPKPPHQKKHNPYYWWRRFPSKDTLHPYKPLLERIQNGDFEYSEYFQQASWEDHWCKDEIHQLPPSQKTFNNINDIQKKYSKRKNLLYEDGFKDEKQKLNNIVKEFSVTFGGSYEEVAKYMESFNGTLEDMYFAYGKHKGYNFPHNKESLDIYNGLLNQQLKKRKRGRPRKNPEKT